MPVNAALAGADVTNLNGVDTVKRYLLYVPASSSGPSNNLIATARVNQASFTYPLAQLTVDTTSAGWSNVEQGETVYIGSAAGLHDRGIYRVRKPGDATTLYLMEMAEGDSGLLADGARVTTIQDNDYITIYKRFDLFSVVPRISYPGTGLSATTYEDYDLSVAAFNSTPGPRSNNITMNGQYGHAWFPVANGATKSVVFVAAPDYWPTSISITAHAWQVPASFGAPTAGSAATATVTYNVPIGFHVVRYISTENNGLTLISYRMLWVTDDPDTGTFPPLRLQTVTSPLTRTRQFARMSVGLTDTVLAAIPDGAMVMYVRQCTWNGVVVATAAPNFVGWLLRTDWSLMPGLAEAEAHIVGPAGLLAGLGGFSQWFDVATSPANWQQIVSALAYVDYLPYWMLRFRAANLLQLFDYTPMNISNFTGRLTAWRINQGNLLAQIQELVQGYSANFGSDTLGNFFCRQHPSLMDTSLRAASIVRRDSLTPALYQSASVANELRPQVRYVKGEAFFSDGVTNTPLTSEAPGKAPGQAAGEERLQGQLVESQDDLNGRAGRFMALRNNPWPQVEVTLKHNRDVYEPAQMQRVSVQIPSTAPNGVGWTKDIIPDTSTERVGDDGLPDIILAGEAETDGVAAVTLPIPPPQINAYGTYSNPLLRSPIQPPATWGQQNTTVPFAWLHATTDGYVVAVLSTGGAYRNISPSASLMAALGPVVKLIADPFSYARLILIGANAILICDNAQAASPTWRKATLNGSTPGVTALNYNFLVSNQGWIAQPGGTYYTAGLGWHDGFIAATQDAISIVSPSFSSRLVTTVAVTFSANWTGTNPIVRIFDQTFTTVLATDTTSGVTTVTVTVNQTLTGLGINADPYLGDYQAFAGYLVSVTITSTSAAGDQTLISDVVGSINRKGYFAWLSKRDVAGTPHVFFNATTNGFASVAISTDVAVWASDLTYSIQMGCYNAGSTGVVLVTAGSTGSGTSRVYKSTNWGSTFSNLVSLNTRGGALAVPYMKTASAGNGGTSPQYGVVKGLNAGNLEFIDYGGVTRTIVATADYPLSGQALNSWTLDGRKLNLALSGGSVYKSDDGGTTWAAAAAAVPFGGRAGANVNCLNGSPSNPNFLLASGNKCLAHTTNRGTTWVDDYATAYDTFRSGAFGSAATGLVTALPDLARLYSRPVTR